MAKSDLRLKSPDLSRIHPALRPFAVELSTVKPDPDNARYHSTRNVRAIADSLSVFGQRAPLIASMDRVVKVGNGRLEAMVRLEWTHAAVLFVEDDRLDAYAIADNRTGELAGWDYAKLLASIRADAGTGNLIGYIPSEIREIEKAVAALNAEAALAAGKARPPAVIRCPRCGHEYEETNEADKENQEARPRTRRSGKGPA